MSKRFRVGTDRSEYRAGEQVTVTARVLDREFKPSTAPEVFVRIESDGGERRRLKLDAVGGEVGNFRATTMLRRPGTYRVRLDMTERGADPESMWHQFLVVRSVLEFESPTMRKDELTRLAAITGGQYFDITRTADVPAVLKRLKAATIREVSDEFWNAPVFFAVFCLLFVTELIYRKRKKLL
jgi:hypothetical protein